jgi:alpha-glucosidase
MLIGSAESKKVKLNRSSGMFSDRLIFTRHVVCPVFALLLGLSGAAYPSWTVASPDGEVVVTFEVKEIAGQAGCPVYRLSYSGRAVLIDSRLGLALEGAAALESGFQVVGVSHSGSDGVYRPVYGERSEIRDNYNQMIAELKERSSPGRRMRLVFRAYNEGAAFRYDLPEQEALGGLVISSERTQFRFAGDHTAWAVYSAQGQYHEVRLSGIKDNCERPLTVQVDQGLFAAVGEAALVDYARMRLSPDKGNPYTLVSSLGGGVEGRTPLRSPWRFVMVGRSPGDLLEKNYLLLNLNEPCAIEAPSWIKPGKVIREVTLTTEGGKACVDFAVKHNVQYVEYDAGWYGPENSDESDATTVTVDPKRSRGPLNLHEVIDYAKERGIGILLYVNHKAAERQLDEILPLYEKWGVKGVKYGFVNVGSQKWTSWLHHAVRRAAEHHLMVDVHDEYRPTGYSRTYPNLMTQEGIAGDETRPANSLTLTILFTRMLAGAGDNTICYYDSRVDTNATHAYQLAKAVCFYSPWQFLYWYDRPADSPQRVGGAGGSHNLIGDEPELEFFDHVPTVWDDTKVIHGRIGRYGVIARRSGEEWFIGCINSGTARVLDVPLDFLAGTGKYVAHIYCDDASIDTRTHVRIDRFIVDSATTLKAAMTAQGGQAVRIVPAGPGDAAKYRQYEGLN